MSNEVDKKLLQIVCICKGINLRRVLKGLMQSHSVAEVNAVTGTGSGGCQGQRCGPRIRILLDKKKALVSEPAPQTVLSPEL